MSERDSGFEEEHTSRFTYRDLQNLSRSVTDCPLRVIALIDFDAFYAQCETVRLGLPESQPLVVQQWDICIALNYPAKKAGLKRIVTPEEAKLKCPEIVIQHVPTWREGDSTWAYRKDVLQHMKTDKAALDPYRLQSRRAFDLIKSKLPAPPVQKVEKASIDEVFLDLSSQVYSVLLARYNCLAGGIAKVDSDLPLPTPPTTLLEWHKDQLIETTPELEVDGPDWDDVALNIGADIVRSIRRDIYKQLHYTCSAGIARNKTLSKLAAGNNKPNNQTVIRTRAVNHFLADYAFTKIRGLGGKFGQQVAAATKANKVSELLTISLQELRSKLGPQSGTWVYNVIRGNEHSEVVERTQLQSMLAAKTFVPKAKDLGQAEKWLKIFAGDLMGRLQEQDAASSHRRPRVIAVHHAIDGRFGPTRSKQTQIPLGAEIHDKLLYELSRDLLMQISREGPTWPCLGLSVSLANFQDGVIGNHRVTSYFVTQGRGRTENSVDGLEEESREREASPTKASKRQNLASGYADSDHLLTRKKIRLSAPVEVSETPAYQESNNVINDTPNASVTDALYTCPNCGKRIASDDVLEHLDWHLAVELQET